MRAVLQGPACAFVCEEAACMTWCVELCTFVVLCVYTCEAGSVGVQRYARVSLQQDVPLQGK